MAANATLHGKHSNFGDLVSKISIIGRFLVTFGSSFYLSHPPPKFKWFKDNTELTVLDYKSISGNSDRLANAAFIFESENSAISNSGDMTFVNSSNFDQKSLLSYQGEYYCQVINPNGRAQSGKIIVRKAKSPKILRKNLQELKINKDESIILPCTKDQSVIRDIMTLSDIQVIWKYYDKNDKIEPMGNTRKLLNDGSLLIKSTGTEWELKVQCTLYYSNPRIEMTTKALKYNINVIPGTRRKARRPKIIYPPKSSSTKLYRVNVGNKFTFNCIARDPGTSVYWVKASRPDYKMGSDKDASVLLFYSAFK